MKIGNSNANTLITSTESAGSKFKIQATGKAFSILSNALYQYKVKAVVREIGCNAYDAHIDAGNTATPFSVTLPSKEDPHFKVRDFGIGLAEDKFVEVYTTYFGSSKADSNDHTGGLGLGSKTPFIMSKTFTVHSFYNGTDFMWHSYVNDNGEPDVVMLHQKPTTEPNGLLVIVPIGQGMSTTEQNALFNEFQQEAQTIYQWFDVLPNVTCAGKNVSIKRKLESGAKYSALKLKGMDNTTVYFETDHSKTGQAERVMVKMGNVVYPYNLKEVKNLDRFGGAIGTAERMIRYLTSTGRLNSNTHPLVIEVGMGDVDIAPSREGLSLSNTTELTIINALVRFTDMFFDQVQTTIDTAKTTFEKYQALFAVPPMGGRKFKVDGKEVDPLSQNPVWAFGSSQALMGRDNYLRQFSSEDLCVKYRRAGTRGIIPLNTSFDMTMYGPGIKDRNVILIDKAYKGELRLWVNANTNADASVVVVFGRDVKGNPIPLTDVEMAPFLEDAHPQVRKFSQLTNIPAQPTRAAAAASLKVTDDTMLVMARVSEYNFFTQGNSSLEHLNTIKPFDPAKDKIETINICYLRQSGKVWAELQDINDGTTLEHVEMASWSRAQSNSGSFSTQCSYLAGIFNGFVGSMGKSLTFEHDGTTHAVKRVRHVVLNKEGYAAVVGNPDYPNFITVDTAIKKLIFPIIPVNFQMYDVVDREMFVSNYSGSGPAELMALMGLTEYARWQKALEAKLANTGNDAIRRYENNSWIQHRHYSQGKVGFTTHTYAFTETAFKAALGEAAQAGIAGAAELKEIFGLTRHTIRETFNTYRASESLAMIKAMIQRELKKTGYDSTVMDRFMISFAEKTHKKT